jgi:hypothetical protein
MKISNTKTGYNQAVPPGQRNHSPIEAAAFL